MRFLLARHLLDQGDVASTRFLLQPIAYSPHDRAGDDRARQPIALIDAGKIAEARIVMAGKSGSDGK